MCLLGQMGRREPVLRLQGRNEQYKSDGERERQQYR